ncbi:MAG: hypothetical protein E6K94_06830 [Thaumarchaeota archaeon]|nr:MAG: hypothetical protein E6L03_06640 [Nitrososphaerota archaeon]TLX86732.1 MAG: hypothetical protein E6L01_03300 [Nitrososphaerota archaeon]TLX90486.1 MAG: hypothetical protein E6K94_06830 [Nitrososphaerota archaeon]
MVNDAWKTHTWETIAISHLGVTRITMQYYAIGSSLLMWIFFCTLFVALGLFFSSISMNSTYAQIELTTDENISSPIFNRTVSEDAVPRPDILYSALHSDTIVGEVLNNFTYPIELVHITASVYDKNGLIAATGEYNANDYQIKPGSRSGFHVFLHEKLPNNSKYTLTTSFEKSEDDKPAALLLSVDTNSKGPGSYKVLGEVINQGPDDANSVKVSGIFYDKDHKVVDVDYTYTNPDIIKSNNKAPFELSFYTDNSKKINSVAINAQSDEYSLITNNTQNKTKSDP